VAGIGLPESMALAGAPGTKSGSFQVFEILQLIAFYRLFRIRLFRFGVPVYRYGKVRNGTAVLP
jgi:hypothetical protein